MNKRKKTLIQAAVASLGLAFVGVGVNVGFLTATTPEVSYMEADRIEIDLHAREEAMEDSPPAPPENLEVVPEGALGADGLHRIAPEPSPEVSRREERSRAMVRVEEINQQLEGDLFPSERMELEAELEFLLAKYFPVAAGERARAVHAVEEEHPGWFNGLDIFNKLWTLFQAIILAWIPYKFQKHKKEKFLTESTIDKIDESLRARYRTDRIDTDA